MKIYLCTVGLYSDYRVYCVYKSEEEAKKWLSEAVKISGDLNDKRNYDFDYPAFYDVEVKKKFNFKDLG